MSKQTKNTHSVPSVASGLTHSATGKGPEHRTKYRYDLFGNAISKSGTLADANVYRFSSKEIHVNSGMYYYGQRFYDPNLQRWLNRDPLQELGGMNLYGFVGNNPLHSIDPWGYEDKPTAGEKCKKAAETIWIAVSSPFPNETWASGGPDMYNIFNSTSNKNDQIIQRGTDLDYDPPTYPQPPVTTPPRTKRPVRPSNSLPVIIWVPAPGSPFPAPVQLPKGFPRGK
jgi:RHS repeat-associated protein